MILSHVSTELEIDLNQANLERDNRVWFASAGTERLPSRMTHKCNVAHSAIAEPKPTIASMSGPTMGGSAKAPILRTFPDQVQAHARVRMMKIFHSVAFVEGIINDFSFYTQNVFAEDLFLGVSLLSILAV
jgi:hypothetical protein